MWVAIRRSIVPVLLLLCGVAMLVYGARFRRVLIARDVIDEVQSEEQYEEEVPESEIFPELAASRLPWEPPRFITVVKTRVVTEDVTEEITERELEPALIRLVTIGGVAVLASGELKLKRPLDNRPGKDGQPAVDVPSLCDT